jgi:DUF4097 and DUF4098 domain-containing protein YvlB
VTSQKGNVEITGEPRDDVVVDHKRHTDVHAGPAGVDVSGAGSVKVRCPAGTDVLVGSESGNVTLRGRLGDARVTAESGNVEIDHARRVDARAASGSIVVDECDEECRCNAGSGSVRVGRAGSVVVTASSGSVEADAVGAADVRAGSGSVRVGLVEPGAVAIDVHSGSVDVTVPHGLRPATDLRATSGSVRCDCEPGNDGRIEVTARSGAITVTDR